MLIAQHLKQLTRMQCEQHLNAFLFSLAPSGVYPATPVTRGAVRSYHTISPLPIKKIIGGIFSVALVVGLRPPAINWHSALWSPDFPPLQKM